MSLVEEYKRQFAWRDWGRVMAELPDIAGQTVLDLGCGVGDLAAELAARGARVIGVDLQEDLLRAAQSRRIPGAEFRLADLRTVGEMDVLADGLWCSFAAAYFPNLAGALAGWSRVLRPGAWIALTEMDDLFAHTPVSEATQRLLAAYASESLVAGRYDFLMGRKLREHLTKAGFLVGTSLTLEDRELAFDGPALPEVILAWRQRLDRMKLLQEMAGDCFPGAREDFLACLSRPDHRCDAKVFFCTAAKP